MRTILALFLFAVTALADDVIHMKNGDVYRGQVLEQEFGKYLQLRFSNGNEKRLKWSEVKSLKKESVRTTAESASEEGDAAGFRPTLFEWSVSGSNLQFLVSESSHVLTLTSGMDFTILYPALQFGLSLEWVETNGADALLVLAGPTFNFPFTELETAFFLTGGAGVTVATGASAFTFAFNFGKRFRLYEQLTYRPSIGIVKVGGGNVVFSINAFSASLVF